MDDPPPSEPKPSGLSAFWAELKRRHVVRVAFTYAVVAWIIVQVAATVFPQLGIPEWATKLVTLLVMLGFPITLIIAWAFELTPQGIKATDSGSQKGAKTSASAPAGQKNGWRSVALAAAVPTLVFGVLATTFYIKAKQAEADIARVERSAFDKTIAVIPFENRSKLDEDQSFTDGVHDELLTQLSKIKDLTTRSRTSVMGYKDSPKDMRVIGEELKVANILEGGVQRAGNHIRINVQLIDARTDSHIWAEIFNREMSVENLFDIQSEIAAIVAEKLKALISPEEKKRIGAVPTEIISAWEAYIKGKEIVEANSINLRDQALAYFKEAIELDSDFALAWAGLSSAYLIQLPIAERVGDSREEIYELSERAARRALELDDSLAEVHFQWGRVLEFANPGSKEAIDSYNRALQIRPNFAAAHIAMAGFGTGGRALVNASEAELSVSLQHLEKALLLDPNNFSLLRSRGSILRGLGRFDEARGSYNEAIRLSPEHSLAHASLGSLEAYYLGRIDYAIQHFRKAIAFDSSRLIPVSKLVDCYASLEGRTDAKEAIFWARVGEEMAGDRPHRVSYTAKISWLLESPAAAAETHRRIFGYWLQPDGRRILLDYDIRNGTAGLALERYRTHYPFLFEDRYEITGRVDGSNMIESSQAKRAIELAEIFLHLGDRPKAEYLLDRAWDYLRTIPRMADGLWNDGGYGVQDVYRYALKGDKQKALAALEEAIEAGYRNRIALGASALDSIREEPEFIALMEKVEADWAQQLANVRRMEASGELEPIPEEFRKHLDVQ